MLRRLTIVMLMVSLISWAGPSDAETAPPSSGEQAAPVVASKGEVTASARRGKISRPYSQNWVFRSTKLNRCAFISAEGRMAANWRLAYPNSGDRDTLIWSKMRLINPTVKATAWPIRGAGCDSTKRWNMKAKLGQGWFQAGCDLDVSVGVGYPWSVSAAPSFSCGDNRVGHRTSTEGRSRKTLAQFNSGTPIRFESTLASRRAGGVSFGGQITARIFTRNASDSNRYRVDVNFNR